MSLSELQSRLGTSINPELLELALTHSSYAYEKGGEDNERLEFLGDSILGYLVAVRVFNEHSDLAEGELTKLKNGVVSAAALATAANRIELGQHLRLGKGEEQTNGRSKVNLLADAFEALLGAAYLSGGIEAALAIVQKHIYPLLDDPDAVREASDPKTSLIEKLQKLKREAPRYEVEGVGPEHERIYTATCFSGSQELSKGSGTTKRSAETQAAINALRALLES
ncbi:ribonuclease III [Aquiluna borgnonia]|uniref:Ribonuclease 3 n=1 Tax=Aquiluna borgnonia TaxID=2499157 RepID=A0A7D4QMJ1_9MICO|nr:ribonuclease III [Aquiluna borgnonia]QKJ25067.1 ribonuclease III [Aquiluna borgnonia]